ncbi:MULTISPECIES: type VI secretion system membrane subunit TssM [Ramlibacter]|uniref:Type VI secretion system membrane subunit TssM n=1 Tax=Ramlibacter pinisoli TaxID=2682844 RepID=A0A6N8IYW6_9BURK|nr:MULTISPECIES: type VI secretion system membrane subunit TssM [Ramlibacter]MBA2962084.1 type VI secretion system membrane subunit TssM [Ramlibacter sp. CGMCC 1.13660]MVQ32027.1 type VI secretion system membrane subunit TssM [Ramlibacter pinisoli]
MKAPLPFVQGAVNLGVAGALLWYATPLIEVGGRHPFDNVQARAALVAGIVLLVVGALGLRTLLARRRNERLLKGIGGATGLDQRFRQALAMLRHGIDAKGAGGWWKARGQVQQLPWYLIIGAPGAGKTTALLHSGLRFPLADKLGRAPLAGAGGTRQCDWWFGEDAVFIDTAGRYTTQDSDAAADAREWQEFLALLRRHRPLQPINGVLVTVSVPDLLHGGSELARQTTAIAARLDELRRELDLAFPVYLLVTKADLLAGFMETFGELDAGQREQLWGVVFDDDAAGVPADLGWRLSDLSQRLARRTPEALQRERMPRRRLAVYAFAAQFDALLAPLELFVRKAFAGIGARPAQRLRAIALASGTQEGNPIDRVIGELARSHGLALKPLPRPDAGGKSFFLTSLLRQLVIAEAPLAGHRLQRLRRRRQVALLGAGVAGAALLAVCALLWQSYQRNLAYVAAVHARVEQLTRRIGALESASLEQVLPLYSLLERLAANDGIDPEEPAAGFGFGLFQGPRLARSAEQAYREMLDRSLAPLLVDRLRRDLREGEDSATRYEALRASLMLGSPARLVRAELRRWAGPALARAGGAGERAEWSRHADALLERSGLPDAWRPDEAGVKAARSALAALPLSQRVHEHLLRRVADPEPPQDLPTRLGAAGALMFAATAAGPMPVHASAVDWRRNLAPQLEATFDALANEADWVLGDAGGDAKRLQRDPAWREDIARQVGRRHAQRVIAAWTRQLEALALAPGGDADDASRQAIELTAPDSPLRRLLTRLADEFSATPQGGGAAEVAFDAALRARFGPLGDYAAGPGPQALDQLHALATRKRQTADTELDATLRNEAARAPPALRKLWFDLGALVRSRGGARPGFDAALAELANSCKALTQERFPFGPAGSRDMAPSDFARLFGPGGLFDDFRRHHLGARVDTSTHPWKPRGTDANLPLAFEQAAAIGALFFPGGVPMPELHLNITPQRMDAELLQFSVDVDGQLLRFENGPIRGKELVWPGPAATQKVLMRILPPGPGGVGAELHEGPFAWVRVLLRSDWGGERGAPARLTLAVDRRALGVEASAAAAPGADIWTLRELSRFSCPPARW